MAPKAQAPQTALTLPAPIVAEPTAVGFQQMTENRATYLSFPMGRSKNWVELKTQFPDLSEYEPVIVSPSILGADILRPCHKPMTFRCWYAMGLQCYTELSIENGSVLRSARTLVDTKMREHCESVLLVEDAKREFLYPCKASFRNAMASTIKKMESMRQVVESAEWVEKSALHAATVKFPPQYRCYYEVRVFTQVSRTDASFKYPLTQVTPIPTQLADIERLNRQMSDDGYADALTAVLASYRARANEISSKFPA